MGIEVSKKDILARTSLFENISDHSRNALADIALRKNLSKKQILFFEGDIGQAIYILITGSIQIYKTAPDGREVVIKVVKPGEMFAEVILFESPNYPVSAVALTSGAVFMIPKQQFICLLEDQAFRNDFIGALMHKMRYLAGQIQYLTLHDVEDRLFLFLQEQFGRVRVMTPRVSKKDVASAIATTPETLSRLLLRLRREKRLSWEGKQITVAEGEWERFGAKHSGGWSI
jgi:CRP/FNR family transcriptional regulator